MLLAAVLFAGRIPRRCDSNVKRRRLLWSTLRVSGFFALDRCFKRRGRKDTQRRRVAEGPQRMKEPTISLCRPLLMLTGVRLQVAMNATSVSQPPLLLTQCPKGSWKAAQASGFGYHEASPRLSLNCYLLTVLRRLGSRGTPDCLWAPAERS